MKDDLNKYLEETDSNIRHRLQDMPVIRLRLLGRYRQAFPSWWDVGSSLGKLPGISAFGTLLSLLCIKPFGHRHHASANKHQASHDNNGPLKIRALPTYSMKWP
jgi:hypothetical protein